MLNSQNQNCHHNHNPSHRVQWPLTIPPSGMERKRHYVLLCHHHLCRMGLAPNYSCLNIPGLFSMYSRRWKRKSDLFCNTGDNYHGLLLFPLCDVWTQHSSSVHCYTSHQRCRSGLFCICILYLYLYLYWHQYWYLYLWYPYWTLVLNSSLHSSSTL